MLKRVFFYTFLIIFIIAGYFIAFNKIFADSIFPRVECCNSFKIGALTKDQAEDLLNIFIKEIEDESFKFYAKTPEGEKQVTIDPRLIALQDPDLSRSLVNFQVKETVNYAFKIGRKGSIFSRLKKIIESHFKSTNIDFLVEIKEKEFKRILQRKFEEIEKKPINPGFKLQQGEVVLTQGKPGFSLDYDKVIKDLYHDLSLLKNEKQVLHLKKEQPKVTDSQKQTLLQKTIKISDKAPYKVFYKDKEWLIDKSNIINWLHIVSNPQVKLALKENQVKEFLKEKAKDINIPPQKGRLEIENGKVIEFKEKKRGQIVNMDQTFNSLSKNVLNSNQETKIVVDEVNPPALPEDLSNLGIDDLVGKGTSNFAGSPQNRRHNIRVGMEKLHGILIKPGEEFSLVEALGEVDKKHGFLPELVIKEDRTIPEYGGGLCQIATTMFRVALDAGLSITERRNHSYRVHYYEPPVGMDATIYIPKPDFKFINDMDHHLLLQGEIDGNNLIFKLYGTPDGRKVITGEPKVFNITEPGSPKIIKTDQLPPGERKKVESSHKGAQAVFTNTVIFANGIKRERKWHSYYKAWPEVWMVGKKEQDKVEDNNSNNETN